MPLLNVTMRRAQETFILLALACLVPIFCAQAQDNLRPGVIGQDNRVTVIDKGPPWDAIGQVNVSRGKIGVECTEALWLHRVWVLTAAHCVTHAGAKTLFPPGNIHFLAGARVDYTKHSTANCLHFLEGYFYLPTSKIEPSVTAKNLPLGVFAKDFGGDRPEGYPPCRSRPSGGGRDAPAWSPLGACNIPGRSAIRAFNTFRL